ncbi:hypothetical protein ALI144C_24810 [Actinosynnema sp. ALI-1.44]|uniref:PucR family transcriptional regulator n=1 Tax=Actinosynnema sp. ALI-1.44 TaxID=1933779 RepID=UPI00097C78E1|nr:PucR family transcriptional regulator [Actinosynnema sp. ALI-1.44]ONI79943.1 hypothetical protein ALI144C_24810 [Actinosynnema sp. ALI-1.44]
MSSTFGSSARLWASLPGELAVHFRHGADRLTSAILREVRQAVPEYRQPLDGAVRHAITGCLDMVNAIPRETSASVFHNLGRTEYDEGRDLSRLQTAYRVGGRVAWRHVREFGRTAGVPANVLYTCAEAILAYVDEISALSVEGYTAAMTRVTDTQALRRKRLVDLLVADPPVAPDSIAAQAALAQWPLPDRVTVVAVEPHAGEPRGGEQDPRAPGPHSDVLVDLERAQPCLITGDPERHLEGLTALLPGRRLAVGPAARIGDAPRSLSLARRTLGLVQRGVLPDQPVSHSADHLCTLWLLGDEFLVREIRDRTLRPFDGLTPGQRKRLGETLLVWLGTRGSVSRTAQELAIHPQTVRYRVHRLIELFGDRLDDPDARLRIQIALRADALIRQV